MVEYDKDAIVYPYITEFLRKEIPERCGILKELEEYAEINSVPIVQPETAKLLETLMCLKRPVRILEVGCAIGYSAILMANYLILKIFLTLLRIATQALLFQQVDMIPQVIRNGVLQHMVIILFVWNYIRN
jgi:hypothetical protein